jgi:hypothetical protein
VADGLLLPKLLAKLRPCALVSFAQVGETLPTGDLGYRGIRGAVGLGCRLTLLFPTKA